MKNIVCICIWLKSTFSFSKRHIGKIFLCLLLYNNLHYKALPIRFSFKNHPQKNQQSL